MSAALRLAPLAPGQEAALAAFFSALEAAGDTAEFHPHPFTPAEAAARCAHAGEDLYVAIFEGDTVLGYGMLRGWDAGYAIPSLGIALHPDARGQGLASLLMGYLHALARRRGAPRVRLKVYAHNHAAVRLYERLGYRFDPALEAGQRVGYFDLERTPTR